MSRRFAKGPRKRRDGRSRLNTPLRRGAHERLMASADVVALRMSVSLLITRAIVAPRVLRAFKSLIATGALQTLVCCVSGAAIPLGISDHVSGRTLLFPSCDGRDFSSRCPQPGHIAHMVENVLFSTDSFYSYLLAKRG